MHHQVAVTEAHAQLLPADKVEHLRALREERRGTRPQVVGMVGDGINDSPALAFATVGIAMGKGGAAAAMEAANVVLMHEDLTLLVAAVQLGRLVLRKIIQNLLMSIGSKVAVMVAGACGYTWLWLAILADVGTMILVTLNGASILGWEAESGRGAEGDDGDLELKHGASDNTQGVEVGGADGVRELVKMWVESGRGTKAKADASNQHQYGNGRRHALAPPSVASALAGAAPTGTQFKSDDVTGVRGGGLGGGSGASPGEKQLDGGQKAVIEREGAMSGDSSHTGLVRGGVSKNTLAPAFRGRSARVSPKTTLNSR